jgi:signal peptidase I
MRHHLKLRTWFLIITLSVAAAVLLANRYVCGLYRVKGTSMTPTLLDGDLCLVWKLGPKHYKRGDIIFFRTSDDPPVYFVKRIIAVPGETVSMEAGQLFINGEPMPEPYTQPNRTWGVRPTRLPHDFYFFMGDHRATPVEFHLFGTVSARNIEGRVVKHWRFQ